MFRVSLALLLLACHRDKAASAGCESAVGLVVSGATVRLAGGGCATVALKPTVLGEGALDLRFEVADGAVTPVITAGDGGGTFEALMLSGAHALDGDQAPRIWKQGYQSWWWSGVADLGALTFTSDGLPVAGGDGDGTSALDETPATSWWVGLVGRPEGGSLLLGALSASKTKLYTAFTDAGAWVVWGGRGEHVALDAGESLTLDPLWAASGEDAWQLYRAYAAAVAAHQDLPPPAEPPPVGWSSWTVTYADLDETTVRAQIAAITVRNAAGALAPVGLLQLDDGWETAWGDWTANARFPSGLAAIAGEIAAAGLRPGLWMAPFYVEAGTGLPDAHPDWFVHDADGAPLHYSNFGSHEYWVLDVTQPEAAAWLGQQISDRVAEGFTYLKLDFLYAGAQEGARYEDVTGMEAFQRGVAILRAAAGPNTWILACGAPMLPSVGFAQSYRSGADIAFDFDPDPRPEYLRWQARATSARGWQNGIWWWVDPDSILTREPFDLTEATGAVVANLAAGGPWILGDDLTALDEDRLALTLNPAAAALRGQVARPEDPLDFPSGPDFGPIGELASPDDEVPVRWTLEDGTALLLNLSADAVAVDGPGGLELQSGETAPAGTRTLAAGQGEIWVP